VRILIVEDDHRIAEPLAEDLRRQRHVVDVSADGPAGLAFAETSVYDVVLLDVMLPGIDGIEICRRLRAARTSAFVLMLTARDTVADKVAALDCGADDYIVKPFALDELAARIRAVARRGSELRPQVVQRGDLALDTQALQARFGSAPIELTRTEYTILETLMRNATQVFSRAMLADRVRDFGSDTNVETIKSHVANLRRKIRGAGCAGDPIVTVYGAGYRLGDALQP
jgi:two-component system response regulator QseB